MHWMVTRSPSLPTCLSAVCLPVPQLFTYTYAMARVCMCHRPACARQRGALAPGGGRPEGRVGLQVQRPRLLLHAQGGARPCACGTRCRPAAAAPAPALAPRHDDNKPHGACKPCCVPQAPRANHPRAPWFPLPPALRWGSTSTTCAWRCWCRRWCPRTTPLSSIPRTPPTMTRPRSSARWSAAWVSRVGGMAACSRCNQATHIG